MPVPTSMSDLSTTAGSNSPAGTEAIGNSLDNYLRATQAILRSTYALASSTIAAASTTDLATADAESVQVTGTATVTSLGTGFNGCYREVRFTGACTLTHSANLVLPGATNIVTVAGDVLSFRCVGTGQWVMTSRARALTSAEVTTALGYTPVNKAGDTGVGNLTLTSTLTAPTVKTGLIDAQGTTGFQVLWNLISGTGATEYVNNNNGLSGGYAWYDRANTGSGVGTVLMSLSAPGNLALTGAVTPGGGKKLAKITLSTSAPGVLADGELYLRY